jgi:hypothetical protein
MPPNDNDASFLLGKMDAKLDALLTRSEATEKRLEELDKRVRALEQFRWMIFGGALALGGAGGWLAHLVTST